jgi:integrase
MDALKNKIIELRPNLSNLSVITYVSILSNLYKKVYNDKDYTLNKFIDTEKILKFLNENYEPRKRKTILSALVVLTEKPEYRNQMLKDIQTYNKEEGQQQLSEKQKEVYVNTDEVKRILAKLKKEATEAYNSLIMTPSMNTLQTIQNYIIMCLFSGVYIPPRRSKDYINFKIKPKSIDKQKDNYMDKNTFVFNDYKTSKTYGQQIVSIPKELQTIIKKWIKVNPTEYLLFDTTQKQLTVPSLTHRLNKIFDKKVSVNQLRHTFLSDKYQGSIKTNEDMEEDLKKMGSSMKQQKIYIKKNITDNELEIDV